MVDQDLEHPYWMNKKIIEYYLIFYNIEFHMKSFQNWLDCQLYSSHLKNLTRIKEDTLCMKALNPSRRMLKTANMGKNISSLDLSQHRNESRTKMHHTKNEMKEMKIIQQNLNIANRLFNVSSVISKDKQLQSYRKYQSLFKKSTTNKKFDHVKAKKLRNFMRISQSNYLKGVHKALVKFKFIRIPKVSQGQSTTFWFEVYSGFQKVISPHYTFKEILQDEIKIPFKKNVSRRFLVLFHCSRGLDYRNLGQYCLDCPQTDIPTEFEDIVSRQDSRNRISLIVQIQELKGKSTNFHIR